MVTKKIPPLELRLEDANRFCLVLVGREFDGNPVYAWHGTYDTELYKLVIRNNGIPAKKMLVHFSTGRREYEIDS